MKRIIIKTIYLITLCVGIIIGIYLIVNPINDEVEHTLYDTKEKIKIHTFSNEVKQKIYIEDNKTFRLLFFLNSEKEYDNFVVKLVDKNYNVIFDNHIDNYQAQAMFFEFPFLEKNEFYTLIITDLDNDNVELAIVNNNNNKSFLLNNENASMQLVTYYKKASYSYLWYPIFIFVFLFTVYPFIFGGKNEK